jgi:hypothetical protein
MPYRLYPEVFITAISCVIVFTAANASIAVGWIWLEGSRNPYLPVSLSSIVYEYLIWGTPLAQSSETPMNDFFYQALFLINCPICNMYPRQDRGV